MGKPHKYAGEALKAKSSLPAESLISLAKEAVGAARGGMLKELSARVKTEYPNAIDVSVRGPAGLVEIMTFQVNVSGGDAPRELVTRIITYKTHQSMVLGFIPASPKRMNGWPVYRAFLQGLAETIKRQDPQAQIHGVPV